VLAPPAALARELDRGLVGLGAAVAEEDLAAAGGDEPVERAGDVGPGSSQSSVPAPRTNVTGCGGYVFINGLC
jgi:hypothetical protein